MRRRSGADGIGGGFMWVAPIWRTLSAPSQTGKHSHPSPNRLDQALRKKSFACSRVRPQACSARSAMPRAVGVERFM